jgi:hypothetical protein
MKKDSSFPLNVGDFVMYRRRRAGDPFWYGTIYGTCNNNGVRYYLIEWSDNAPARRAPQPAENLIWVA